MFSASCSKLKSTFKNQFLNYIFHVNHGFNYTKRNGLLELHDRFVCKCINFFLQFENLYSFILQILVEEFKKLCTRCVEKIITCT